MARTSPAEFAKYIKDEICSRYDENGDYLDFDGVKVSTSEGVEVCNAAVSFLEDLAEAIKAGEKQPLSRLKLNVGLSYAAYDHAKEKGVSGGRGHESSNGDTFIDRVNKLNYWEGKLAENINYECFSGMSSVARWIIDDGVRKMHGIDRPHRYNIFLKDIAQIGVACHDHIGRINICVAEFATIAGLKFSVRDKLPAIIR